MHRSLIVATALSLAGTPALAAAPAASAHTSDSTSRFNSGIYEPYQPHATAVTYDPEQVPPGARTDLVSRAQDGQPADITVVLFGLRPNRVYGAHVHTNHCGPTGDDAGPHFQQVPDPKGPDSGDPAFANPANEVWLDFRTDSTGTAQAHTSGTWQLRGNAHSFVIHEEGTHTEPGMAGQAGARLACLTAEF